MLVGSVRKDLANSIIKKLLGKFYEVVTFWSFRLVLCELGKHFASVQSDF